MINRKTVFRLLLLTAIIFIFGGFVTNDFLRIYNFKTAYVYSNTLPTKILVTFLCTLLVWSIGSDGLDFRDSEKLKLIFTVITLADISLAINQVKTGILLFGLCQSLLIWRNGNGIIRKAINEMKINYKELLLFYGAFLLFISGIVFLVFGLILHNNQVIYIIIIYAVLLGTSLLVAVMNYKLRLFPTANGRLTMTGMICFFLCDLNVGISMSLLPGIYQIITGSLTWLFYTPALVLLSLSGFRYK